MIYEQEVCCDLAFHARPILLNLQEPAVLPIVRRTN